MVLPLGASELSITQFGSNANDLQPLDEAGDSNSSSDIVLRTFQSTGASAVDGNAVEFLFVK